MGWKNLSYWLKGGIIGIIVLIILFIIGLILDLIIRPSFFPYTFMMIFLPLIPFMFIIEAFGIDFGDVFLFIAPPAYFTIGVIIGLIVGKIKSKKQQ